MVVGDARCVTGDCKTKYLAVELTAWKGLEVLAEKLQDASWMGGLSQGRSTDDLGSKRSMILDLLALVIGTTQAHVRPLHW